MLSVRYAREIEGDLDQAASWYAGQQVVLGERFLQNFEAAARLIARVGHVCRPVVRDYRRVRLKDYPYSAYFTVRDRTAVIYLVIHTSRDPKLVNQLLTDRR